jgi:CRISPR/Cas system type I-B associated protein Csh2 (Cas7 group RAMP superfamily)
VEKVENFKFLGIHITENLKLSTHTGSVAKKARQLLFNLRKLKKVFSLSRSKASVSAMWLAFPL